MNINEKSIFGLNKPFNIDTETFDTGICIFQDISGDLL